MNRIIITWQSFELNTASRLYISILRKILGGKREKWSSKKQVGKKNNKNKGSISEIEDK